MLMHVTETMNRRLDALQRCRETGASCSAVEDASGRTMRDEHIGVRRNQLPFFAQLIFRQIEDSRVRRNPGCAPEFHAINYVTRESRR